MKPKEPQIDRNLDYLLSPWEQKDDIENNLTYDENPFQTQNKIKRNKMKRLMTINFSHINDKKTYKKRKNRFPMKNNKFFVDYLHNENSYSKRLK